MPTKIDLDTDTYASGNWWHLDTEGLKSSNTTRLKFTKKYCPLVSEIVTHNLLGVTDEERDVSESFIFWKGGGLNPLVDSDNVLIVYTFPLKIQTYNDKLWVTFSSLNNVFNWY